MPKSESREALTQRLMEQYTRIKRGHWKQSPIDELTLAEFETLIIVHRLSHESLEGIRPNRLCDFFGVAAPTVNQYTKKLVSLGYLVQKPDPTDGRAVLLTLTPKAIRIKEESRKKYTAVFEKLVSHIGAENAETLTELLKTVNDYLGEALPHAACPRCQRRNTH